MTIKNLAAAAFAAAALISVPASLGTSLTGSTPASSITAEAASDVIANGCYVKGLAVQNGDGVVADGLIYILNKKNNTAELSGRWSNVSIVNMPDKVKYEGRLYEVTSIAPGSFDGTYGSYAIKEFTAGKYLKYIGNNAFMDSPVRKIVLNSGLETIGNNAFQNTAVQEIVIPATVSKIETHAFDGCNLKTIYIDASSAQTHITIEDTAFANNEQLKYLYNYRKKITVEGTSFKRSTPYINDDDDPNCFYVFGQKRAYLEGIIFGQ